MPDKSNEYAPVSGNAASAREGRPLVLIGETRSRKHLATIAELRWGRMFVTRVPAPFPYEPWGFDNGAFIAWCQGKPFPETDFLRRLERAEKVNSDPYLAVTPDIVAGGRASLEFSTRWRMSRRLPEDWRWYLAVQDGMTVEDVAPHLHLYDGIFLGGTDRFKAQAYRWRELAHAHQLKFHYGRASTPTRLVSAFRVASDSCDSAFPLWTVERMSIFVARWQGLPMQSVLTFPPLSSTRQGDGLDKARLPLALNLREQQEMTEFSEGGKEYGQ